MTNEKPPTIEQVEMTDADLERAEQAASRLGYTQTAYTSSSELWGLFCLNENPEGIASKNSPRHHHPPYCKGCFIKTANFGLVFIACLEDLQLHDLADEERKDLRPA